MAISQYKLEKLIELANEAIAAAEKEKSMAIASEAAWLIECCERAIKNFQSIKNQAIRGALPPSDGAGMGISRALSEWNVSDVLYKAGGNLEDFYRNECGT